MKKLIALLLALVLCLGLAACASESEDDKALAAANALMESGDYEAAMDAYGEIPMYKEISEKIEEAYGKIISEKAAPYVGTWKDLNSNVSFTVNPDGTMQIVDFEGEIYDSMVGYDGENVYVYGNLAFVDADGITHLKDEYNDFVPAENYDALCAKEVEITLENWETYFELREAKGTYTNDFGEVEYVNIGYGIFLRDEYAQKLKDQWDSVHVTFRMQYDEEYHYVDGDYPYGDYSLGEMFIDPWHEYQTKEEVREVSSYFYVEGTNYVSDLLNHYAADFTMGYVMNWNNLTQEEIPTAVIPVNPQIVEVVGTLTLFP